MKLDALRERWDALEPRQRLLYAGGAILVALLLAYEFLWYPLQNARAQLVDGLPALRSDADQFNRNAIEAERLKASSGGRGAVASIQSAVDDAALRHNVRAQLKAVQPLGPDRAQLSFATVPFDGLVRLLADLGQTSGIVVESAQFNAAEAGRVNVQTLIVRTQRTQ